MPRPKNDISPLMADTIANAYSAGATVKDLGEQFGLTLPVVRRTLREKEIPVRPSTQVNEERNRAVIDLHNQGAPLSEIANKFGISKQRAHVIVNRGY